MVDDFWGKIEGLYFCPWEGPNYENSIFGMRILVMGETTYLGLNDTIEQYEKRRKRFGPRYFIQTDILPYRNGAWTASFWTRWINGLLGRETCCLRERQMVLDNVAFWNYADGPPLKDKRTGPPKEYKEIANRKLRQIITFYYQTSTRFGDSHVQRPVAEPVGGD
jgi:hypothetical protein